MHINKFTELTTEYNKKPINIDCRHNMMWDEVWNKVTDSICSYNTQSELKYSTKSETNRWYT